MRSTLPPENIDCASLLACLASSPVGRPPDSADSHVGCRITMSVTQRRYSAASFVRSFLIYLLYVEELRFVHKWNFEPAFVGQLLSALRATYAGAHCYSFLGDF